MTSAPAFGASVWVQHPDGRIQAISPSDGLHYQASISPDGTDIVWYGGASGKPRIWRMTLPDGRAHPITPETTGARHPAFSPDGRRIAFASDRMSDVPGESVSEISSATIKTSAAMKLHLFTSRPDGTDVRQLTHGPHQDHRPTWSPDGEWITFASNRSGETAIWRVASNGSGEPEPIFTAHWGYRPWFTLDGTSVLFYGPDGDRHRIWRVEIGSGTASPIASDDRGITHGPFVQPGSDDRMMAHSTRDGSWGIWEYPLSGSGEPSLLTPPGFSQAAHATRSRDGTLVFDVKAEWITPASSEP
ncbi:MAG: hypothetical protein WD990_02795 [Acidimicrobiia bacterium]